MLGLRLELMLGLRLDELRCNLYLTLVVVFTFTGWRVGGWLEDWRVMLNSTQDQIKLKLKFELSLAIVATSLLQLFT